MMPEPCEPETAYPKSGRLQGSLTGTMDKEKGSKMKVDLITVEYAGFWVRFLAVILDSILFMMVLVSLLFLILGTQVFTDPQASSSPLATLLQLGLPMLATVLFWKYWAATPGKMLMGVMVVDARTGEIPSTGRLILRYLGYFVSTIPLGLGYLWVAGDSRKQGFHDKIAGTLVIRKTASS